MLRIKEILFEIYLFFITLDLSKNDREFVKRVKRDGFKHRQH